MILKYSEWCLNMENGYIGIHNGKLLGGLDFGTSFICYILLGIIIPTDSSFSEGLVKTTKQLNDDRTLKLQLYDNRTLKL